MNNQLRVVAEGGGWSVGCRCGWLTWHATRTPADRARAAHAKKCKAAA